MRKTLSLLRRALQGLLVATAIGTVVQAQGLQPGAPWVADLGDGRYRNPVLHTDYSDPDVVRVGARFYMTASSFTNVPGLPLLESPDLVNWTLVGHALPELVPRETFSKPQYGKGVWAPAIRHHNGKFFIFYPDPDFGIYVVEAENFRGPWSTPRLLIAGKGLIDPAPFWDDDGKAYLAYAWAFSRAGKNNLVTLQRMEPNAARMLDEPAVDIINGANFPGYHTVEGPKLYKAHGYYYVFAPAGGVEMGWQAVFRSRSLTGPYEVRNVMDQGDTPVNGPHQGAWVSAPDGKDWFVHFQDKGPYGRVVHLQPMTWKDGWPLIGQPGRRAGTGEPVMTFKKPVQGHGAAAPAHSDDFKSPTLAPQWTWSANPQPGWYALDPKAGQLRLFTVASPEADGFVRASPAILAQRAPASRFLVTTRLRLDNPNEGDRAGLIVNAIQYTWLGLRRRAGVNELVQAVCGPFGPRCQEQATVVLSPAPQELTLRLYINEGAFVNFAYSVDHKTFIKAGPAFPVTRGGWVGAQVGLFAVGDKPGSWLDVQSFELTAPGAGPY
ncbi:MULTISPECIES: glycoside hydrolase 43 family protein [Roseateles]|uniref:Beta-xylosidase n=1 Tax=Pelomonas aquatica TaxID=431058 RepID=A0ABU1Z2I7_9BURK|nr:MULTISPECIES: glycoside hydrolase 43 family protein [Roseateles]KQY80980.1 glycoside hydrolase [Pelomonas sp. Root1444]MDR7294683.1 beta-xylosidase [Pelomonas aquatica]